MFASFVNSTGMPCANCIEFIQWKQMAEIDVVTDL